MAAAATNVPQAKAEPNPLKLLEGEARARLRLFWTSMKTLPKMEISEDLDAQISDGISA